MSNKSEFAEKLFADGFNCAQSVFAPFSEDYDLDIETALKITSPFGGGCGIAELCGAVSGGVCVVGMKYGHTIASDTGTNMNCRAKRQQFIDEFKKINGCVTCRDLLGYDTTTEEGREKYMEMAKDRLSSPCMRFVKDSAQILENLGY